jgi:Flp pilus assembly protein TadG
MDLAVLLDFDESFFLSVNTFSTTIDDRRRPGLPVQRNGICVAPLVSEPCRVVSWRHTMPTAPPPIAAKVAHDERGAVAILFGFLAMVLMVFIGLAVDQARVYHTASKIAAAADAAALAAGRALMDGAMTNAEISALGERYFNLNMATSRDFANVSSVQVIPNRANSTIEVKVDADVPMTFMRVAGIENVTAPFDTLTTFQASDLELGMALDITGSMSGRKLADLKAAATDLIEALLPDGDHPNKVRIGLAPYSAAVQLGPYAADASNGTSVDGCVRERTGASAFTDDSIGNGGSYRGNGRFTDIDLTEGRQGYFCPLAQIVPLTEDKDTLTGSIDGYIASGSTAGHIGAQWAWNLISPNFASLWPADSEPVAYNDGRTTKAVIIMTDGIFNMAYANGNSSAQALSVCTALGAKGIKVHTVAFEAPASAKTMLQNCATRAGGEFHDAADGDELRQAFLSIANSLNDLRLTQ